MNTIFMNSGNNKTSPPHRLLLNFSDKINLKRSDKYVALSNLSIYYAWKIIKKSCKNTKFKISTPMLNEDFDLPFGSYSVSDIQDYFEYILKNHGEDIDNPSVSIYVDKIENRMTFQPKARHYLKLLTLELMKLLGSSNNKITKDKNGENVPRLEITGVVYCNIVNKDCQINHLVNY